MKQPLMISFFSILLFAFQALAQQQPVRPPELDQKLANDMAQTETRCAEETNYDHAKAKLWEHIKDLSPEEQDICIRSYTATYGGLCDIETQMYDDQRAILEPASIHRLTDGQGTPENKGHILLVEMNKENLQARSESGPYIDKSFRETRCPVLQGLKGSIAKKKLKKSVNEKLEQKSAELMATPLIVD